MALATRDARDDPGSRAESSASDHDAHSSEVFGFKVAGSESSCPATEQHDDPNGDSRPLWSRFALGSEKYLELGREVIERQGLRNAEWDAQDRRTKSWPIGHRTRSRFSATG